MDEKMAGENYFEAYEVFRKNNSRYYSDLCNEQEDRFRFFPVRVEKYGDKDCLNDIFHFFTRCVAIYKADGREDSECITPFDNEGIDHDLGDINKELFENEPLSISS